MTFGSRLLVGVVDAGGGGVEEALDAVLLRGLQQVRVDQHREHAQGLVVLDEAHAAHVGGQVVDVGGALGGALAVFRQVQVERRGSRRRRSAGTTRRTA